MSELKNKLRSVTIGAPSTRHSTEVEWAGEKFEVRRPSLRQQRVITEGSTGKKGARDHLKALVLAIIQSVYVPGTDERVFEVADVEAIFDRGEDDFIGVFGKALTKLTQEANPETVEKNSESDQIE